MSISSQAHRQRLSEMAEAAGEERSSKNGGDLDLSNDATTKRGIEARAKLRSWLGEIMRITITDGRTIVGGFVCTDRSGNIILENSCEYSSQSDEDGSKNAPRMLGLALVPGHHIITMSRMV